MNTQTIKGDWEHLKGQVKEAFAKLTDDDLLEVGGNADRLVDAIQQRYAFTRDQAEQAWQAFAKRAGVATMNAADRAVDRLEKAIRPPADGASPFDPREPALTPEEALVREQAIIDARDGRREF